MGKDHRVPTTELDLINIRLERLAEHHRLLRSAARSPTMPIYDADFPLDGVDGQHALRRTADPPAELAVSAGFYFRNGQWYQYSPGPWVYGGSAGTDGVDAKLAANPHPYATGDGTGPPPFLNGVTNGFFVDALGHVGDGLRFRRVPHGVQVDCGGGLVVAGAPPAANTIIMVLPFGPDTVKAGVHANVDGTGGWYSTLGPDGTFTYVSAI